MALRTPLYVAAAALVLAAAGCGEREPDARALAPVRLALDVPRDLDTVEAEELEVRGRVWPAQARVLVNGEEAEPDGRDFLATVALAPGTNVLDVVAGAPGRRSAMTAVRVVRIVEIEVPDVEGQAPADAVRTLRDSGLEPRLRNRGGLLEELLPGTEGVCGTDPEAGERVLPGTEVEVETSKAC